MNREYPPLCNKCLYKQYNSLQCGFNQVKYWFVDMWTGKHIGKYLMIKWQCSEYESKEVIE